jgi:hypothetical protein
MARALVTASLFGHCMPAASVQRDGPVRVKLRNECRNCSAFVEVRYVPPNLEQPCFFGQGMTAPCPGDDVRQMERHVPGFIIVCSICRDLGVHVENTVLRSHQSGLFGSVAFVCPACGNRSLLFQAGT